MTLKFILNDEMKMTDCTLIDHYFNKYVQLRDSLFRKWVGPQFVLNTIYFDLHLIDRYADDDFYDAVQGNPNIMTFKIVLMEKEIQRQKLNKSNYSPEEFTRFKNRHNTSVLTPKTWLMQDQNDKHLIIADEVNVLAYVKQVVANLGQLRMNQSKPLMIK